MRARGFQLIGDIRVRPLKGKSLDRRRYCETMDVELVKGGQIHFRLLYESFYLEKFVSLLTNIVLRHNQLGQILYCVLIN